MRKINFDNVYLVEKFLRAEKSYRQNPLKASGDNVAPCLACTAIMYTRQGD